MILGEYNGQIRTKATGRHVHDAVVQVSEVPRTLTGRKMEVPVRKLLLGADLGGFLIGGGFALNSIFYVLAGLGLLGVLLTLLVPISRAPRELRSTLVEPTPKAAPGKVAAAAPAKT